MRKDRLYLFTFLAITIIFLLISVVAIRYFVEGAADKVLETQLEFSKREARQIASLIGDQLENEASKEQVILSIQKSIENSNLEAGFVSMFNWSGKIVCHPDVKQIGQQIQSEKSFVSSVSDDLNSKEFLKLLESKESVINSNKFNNDNSNSEVVHLYPVKNSDWIVAAHANTGKVGQQISDLRSKFFNILLVMGFVFTLTSVIIVRLIGSTYEKRLETKNEKLSVEVLNLSKLNRAVDAYQQKVIELPESNDDSDENTTKKRILTYIRHELLPVSIQDIAYIYTENTITYVMCFDGKKSTTNSSLDELFSNLDQAYFFRANRQFIIAISAINKIVRYGNNQLKILIKPSSEVDIIISKNKAAEFKQWLNL